MVVSFTSNIALSKITEDELALNWARVQELQADNNDVITSETNRPVVAYTPLLGAQTTAPTVGAGTRRGEYQDFLGIIIGNFVIEFTDPGITAGAGEYGISLPFPADGGFHTISTAFNAQPGPYSVVGEGYFYDASNVATSGSLALDLATVGGVTYLRMMTEAYTVPAKSSRIIREAVPNVVANGDRFVGNFAYKKA